MPAPTSGRDSYRAAEPVGETALRSAQRAEKAKSAQAYGAQAGPQPTRSQLASRTTSAPLVDRKRGSGYTAGSQRVSTGQAQAGTGAADPAQDEDEVAGVVGAVRRQLEPFRSPQVRRSHVQWFSHVQCILTAWCSPRNLCQR